MGDEIVAERGLRPGGAHPRGQVDLQHGRGRHRPDAGAARRATCWRERWAPGARSAATPGWSPATSRVGDTIDVLNLGGILGRCTSVNPDIGPPFQAEVLGAILAFPELGDRIGRPAHIQDHAVPPADTLESTRPRRLRGRYLHERRQDGRGHRAGARARAQRPPGGRGQAHRRLAHAGRAVDARRRRDRRAHLQRRRHREHAPRRDRHHGQGDLQPPRRRASPT